MSVRFNNIYKDKIKFRNMFEAYKRTSKEKKQNKEVILFELDLASNLLGIMQDLYNDKYLFSNYRKFKIYDLKRKGNLIITFSRQSCTSMVCRRIHKTSIYGHFYKGYLYVYR